MTNDELIAEAKIRYPIGSTFDNSNLGFTCSYEIKNHNNFYSQGSNIVMIRAQGTILGQTAYTLYKDGIWATIVSKPEEKTPEFEVGKWYKTLNSKGSYRKCNKTGNELNYSESIIETGKHSNYQGVAHWTSVELLIDLSEIQQYLPENHVDKFPVKTELTELPEKWCILGSNKLRDSSFREWRGNSSGYYGDSSVIYYHYDGKKVINYYATIKEGYTEISFDEFKQWVLKENVTFEDSKKVDDSLVGRYVKCLDGSNKGHYPCNTGDYLKYAGTIETCEIWGAYIISEKDWKVDGTKNPRYFGGGVSKSTDFELMPEGFIPNNEPKTTKQNDVKNEEWYLKDNLTETQFNALIEHLKGIGMVHFNHAFELTYTNFQKYKFIRTKVSSELEKVPSNEFCIDNNDQNIKTKKVFSDFVIDVSSKEIIPEKGKWYEIEAFGGIKYISKYGDNLKFSEYICNDAYTESGEFQNVKVIGELKSEDSVITEPLLKYAKSKYPVGCRIKSVMSGSEYEVTHNRIFINHQGDIDNSSKGYLYSKGKWASIVSLPEDKVVEKTSDTYPTDVVYQKGQKVRVLRKAESYEKGWMNSWMPRMTERIGQIVTVKVDNSDLGVLIQEDGYNYPHFVLEKVVAEDFLDNDMFKDAIVESNLEKANRLFKVGTKGISVLGTRFTITKDSFPFKQYGEAIYDANGLWELYNCGKWATIESTPQEEWISTFNKTEWIKATIKYDEPIEWKTQSRKVSSSDLIDVEIVVPITIGS